MDTFEQTIIDHALRDAPRECCGVVIRDSSGLKAIPLPNVSPTPQNAFLIEPSAYLEYLKNETLVEYYHSHVVTDEKPSEADIHISEACGFPARIYSLASKQFSVYVPKGYVTPLEGRQFQFGVFDCVSLVSDYYQTVLGIELKPIPRTIANLMQGSSSLTEQLTEIGFQLVERPPRLHDLICMSVGTSNGLCNHFGVYLGNKTILHQLMNRPSCKTLYSGYWEKHTVFIARHIQLL
jgi:proteasome lid subunit RPN8/RPN11